MKSLRAKVQSPKSGDGPVSYQYRLLVVLALFMPFVAEAHIGSPNVVFEGKAGAYQVRIAIRPPPVLPGAAQVDVRAEGGAVTNVTLETRLFDATSAGKQPTVQATRVAGETNFFNGVF